MALFTCKACLAKDETILDLRAKRDMVDSTKDKWIADLQRQIVSLQAEREKDRREFKRAIDLLLMKSNTAPVSDAANPQIQHVPFDPTKAFQSMFEEVPEEVKS